MDKNASFGALCATDALGRKLPTQAQVGALRQERVVGMFYFLTHGAYGPDARGPADVTKILKEHPEAIWDFDHPAWCDGAHEVTFGQALVRWRATLLGRAALWLLLSGRQVGAAPPH